MQHVTPTTQAALAGIHAAAGHGAHTHRTHYTKAMSFIQSHGHFAAITKDGLLALSWEGYAITPMGELGDDGIDGGTVDGWYEAPMVFEVDADGMVVSREVREWLGY